MSAGVHPRNISLWSLEGEGWGVQSIQGHLAGWLPCQHMDLVENSPGPRNWGARLALPLVLG